MKRNPAGDGEEEEINVANVASDKDIITSPKSAVECFLDSFKNKKL